VLHRLERRQEVGVRDDQVLRRLPRSSGASAAARRPGAQRGRLRDDEGRAKPTSGGRGRAGPAAKVRSAGAEEDDLSPERR
jgi:hypothetical protein